jgi:large subunit ribosomal protein L10
MSKPLKDLMTETFKRDYVGVRDACVVDLTGLDVAGTGKLRNTLRSKSMSIRVVKNSLARRAFKGGPLEPLGDALTGPCALVTGGASVIDVAKALVELAKELGKVGLKQAIIDGDPSLLTVEEASRLKGKREIMGELAMLISSPGRAIAGCLRSPGGKIAGCLKTLADRPDGEAVAA